MQCVIIILEFAFAAAASLLIITSTCQARRLDYINEEALSRHIIGYKSLDCTEVSPG